MKWHWAAQRAAAQILTLCTACVCAEFPSTDAERTHINTGGVTTAPNLFPNPQEPKQRGLQEKTILPDTKEDRGINFCC